MLYLLYGKDSVLFCLHEHGMYVWYTFYVCIDCQLGVCFCALPGW